MKNIFLTATVTSTIISNAFGAASVRAPQLGGGSTATPATARAGTLRTQTMKTSMSTTSTTPTVTASISEPIATETTDARLSFLKGIKNLNSGKVKDTTATQQELNAIDSRIEELQSKLDAAESAQANIVKVEDVERAIAEKIAAQQLVTLTQLETITQALPEFQRELQKTYFKTIDNVQYSCGIWQITLQNWEDVLSRFIRPELCNPDNLVYGRDCILDGEPKDLRSEHSMWKWRFGLCTPYTPPVEEHWHQIGYTNPLKATEGLTILTNASDTSIDNGFIPTFCGHASNYWCGKYSIDGEYNPGNPQDRTLKVYNRLEGIYMTQQTFGQSGTNTWIVQTYTTNEPGENSTKAEVAEYIRAQVCEGKEEDECFVPEAGVFIHPTTLWAKPRFQVDVYMRYTPPVPTQFTQIGYDNPLQATEGFTISTNATDAEIDNGFIPTFCGHASDYWCGKYSIDGEYNYDNPQYRTLKVYRRLEGIYAMPQQTFGQYSNDTWVCQTYMTNEPDENSTTAAVAEHVSDQVCEGKEADECFVTHVFVHQTTLWAKPRYQVEVCSIVTALTEPPAPLTY